MLHWLWMVVGCTARVDGDPSDGSVSEAVIETAVTFEERPDLRGLEVALYDAGPPKLRTGTSAPVSARTLDRATVATLLSRVPDLEGAHGDRQNFAMREGSPPPPLPGADVSTPFPPPLAPPVPTVSTGAVGIVRHAPDGAVPMAPHVSITFDQPMVAVTSQEEAAKTVPAKLTPTPPGRWRWLGTRTLLFDPEPGPSGSRMPMATDYTVEIPAGTRSAAGTSLREAVTFTFSTPPPVLVSSWPVPHAGPQPLDPVIVLGFDQRIDVAKVLPMVELRGGAPVSPVALRLATPEEVEADTGASAQIAQLDDVQQGRSLALVPVAPLATNTHYTLVVKAGTPSAEGPRVTPADQRAGFVTYGPLAVTGHHCWHQDPCPPTAPMVVAFNNPLDPIATDRAAFELEPAVPGMSARIAGNAVQVTGAFVGRTAYTLTVPANLTDTFGQTLGSEQKLQFRVGPADKTLASSGHPMVVLDPAGGATLPVWSTNHAALKVKIHRVGPEDQAAWLKFVQSIWYEDSRPGRLPGVSVFHGNVTPPAEPDRQVETAIDFSPYLQDGTGQFVVLIEPTVQPRDRWNRQYVYHWVQVTEMGLTAFVDGTQVVGWATDLATGDPAADVELSLLDGDRGRTGRDGLAALALPAAGKDRPNVLVARRGTDVALLPESMAPQHGTGWVQRSRLAQARWYVADDRGLYRPGEQVRVKGWLRRSTPGPAGDIAPLEVAAGGTVGWRLTSAMGNEIGKGEAELSGLGGFSLALSIPPDANLGTATLWLQASEVGPLTGLAMTHPIEIQEFRRPEFEVSAQGDADVHTLGEHARVDLTAAYYAGGGLPGADVSWAVYASQASYVPPGQAGFRFGTFSPWWFGRGVQHQEQRVATFAGKTDPSGASHLGLHFEALNPPRPTTVRVEGTVVDVNRQAWTATETFLLHPASVYVGLRTDAPFVDKGEDVNVDVIIVDVDGKPVKGTAELTFSRMAWAWSETEGSRQVPTDSQPCAAASDTEGPARCTFPTVTGGQYRVLAQVRDPLGRANETELQVWVSGAETPPSRDVALETLTLVPDREAFRPGDTVNLLVQSPFFPAEGTLTLRRDGLVETRRFTMREPTTQLSVAIADRHVPDLTVSVHVVGRAARRDDQGQARSDLPKRIAHAAGSLTLRVPPIGRTLQVTATPASAVVAPGTRTSLALSVRDAAGVPVEGAELAVVVADESVLALTGYEMPDPIDIFYAARGPGVTELHTRSYVALANPAALPASTPGPGRNIEIEADTRRFRLDLDPTVGDEPTAAPKAALAARGRASQPNAEAKKQGSAAIEMRTDFSALALFAPQVVTGADGRATVPFEVPDSLTRYRVMVVAVDAGNGFGAGDAAITARLPLMVRPSPPRFLNFGDQVELPIVLQNQTDRPMQVDVAVRGTNVRFVDAIGPSLPDLPDVAVSSAGKRVTVPPNDRVEVRFPAATLLAGTARFQAVGATASASDAADFSLPVWTPATTEAFATYGEIDGPGIVQPVVAPPDAWTRFGGLQVTTSSTQLQALTDAVLYLQSYPFECNEQLASRVLAIASLRDVLAAFEAEGLPPVPELEAQVDQDLARLANRQHWNGGFSFWRKGDEPWPMLSIHVANAFARAKAKGYRVPADAWSRSLGHLQNIESHIPHFYSIESKRFLRAYALDVRRRMGDADIRKARALFEEAGTGGMGIDGLAFLLPTFHDAGATAERDTILRHLGNNTTERAGTAHFVTGYADGAHVLLHSARRADGIVLEALIETQPDAELVAKVVRGLLAHRTKGRWVGTQENAFVLLALDRYFRVYESETPDFVARVWLGDDYVGDHAFRGRTTERSHHEVPMGLLTEHPGPRPLTLVKDGDDGRLYYRIGVTYAPRDLRLQPADFGFAVERRYEAVDDPGDVTRDAEGTWRIKAGARVRVALSMANEMRRYHVALVDPLPAGLEAQNPELATTGTLPLEVETQPYGWWWTRTWYEHENLRDERVEAFTSLLWDGAHAYEYIARATTPGRFVVPPTRAEEMYMPETFGRSATDIVVVE